MSRLTEQEVRGYIERHGQKASHHLTRLGMLDSNLHVNLKTEIGREILSEDVDRLDTLLEMVYTERAGSAELSEFRYLKERINRLSKRISAYNSGVREIQEGVVVKQ